MERSSRALWLPALAVLLPCAFIALLGYQWLALEREAATRRGADAARAAAAALRRDLFAALHTDAETVARTLGDLPADRPPFQPPPPPPPMLASAFLFDASGAAIAPSDEVAADRAAEHHRVATRHPTWQAAATRVQAAEDNGRVSEALGAARDLLAQAGAPTLRASALLTLARISASARQFEAAERYAAGISACCAGARDEFGVSFALYAAWQRATMAARDTRSAARLTILVREIGDLAARGYLGAANDVTEIALLAKKLDGQAGVANLVHTIDRLHADIARRVAAATAAARWLSTVGASATDSPALLVGVVRHESSSSMAARARVAGGRTVVMFVDPAPLTAWVERWAADRESFDLTLRRAGGPAETTAVLETPLVPEAPLFTLVARQRTTDPAADRLRRRLFVSAFAAMIVLTLVIGLLAVRDVSREMRTASLQSSFVAAVTHELKTPLASIRLLAETLRWDRARPETKHELFDTIVEETDRLSRLVDNVLSSSRIESGTRLYTPQVVVLPEVVRSAVRRFDSVLKREGFAVVEQIEDNGLRVRADPDALGQAVLNLLGNVVKYAGASREIRVAVGRRDGQAEISVADDGIGIAAAEQTRIFDRFYRSPEVAAHTTGAGLGLPLVRHFAEAHGGRVTVASELGRGSVFSIWLPIASDHAEGGPLGTPAEKDRHG